MRLGWATPLKTRSQNTPGVGTAKERAWLVWNLTPLSAAGKEGNMKEVVKHETTADISVGSVVRSSFVSGVRKYPDKEQQRGERVCFNSQFQVTVLHCRGAAVGGT